MITSSKPSQTHNLFADGGLEILQELPETPCEQMLSENGASRLGRCRVATNFQHVK